MCHHKGNTKQDGCVCVSAETTALSERATLSMATPLHAAVQRLNRLKGMKFQWSEFVHITTMLTATVLVIVRTVGGIPQFMPEDLKNEKGAIKMTDLNTTTKLVKHILETDKQTRNSDSFLYLKVLEYISEKEGFALNCMTVPYFLENMNDYGFPGFETVRRTRQKVQAECPDLAASDKVQAMRMENEQAFKAYALGVLES